MSHTYKMSSYSSSGKVLKLAAGFMGVSAIISRLLGMSVTFLSDHKATAVLFVVSASQNGHKLRRRQSNFALDSS